MALPRSGLVNRGSITARKSLSTSSLSPANTRTYGDSPPVCDCASREDGAQAKTTLQASATSRVQILCIEFSPRPTIQGLAVNILFFEPQEQGFTQQTRIEQERFRA